MTNILAFLFVMWVLLLLGGAAAVAVFGPLASSDAPDLVMLAAKAAVAVLLVTAWVLALARVKNWMFRKELGV